MTCRNPRGTPPAPAVAWARLGGMSALTCCWRDPWAPLQSGEPGAQAASRSLVNDLATSAADLAGQIDAAASVHRGDRDGGGLDATATLLAAVDRLTAAVITLLQATDHHDVIAEHGVTRDTWLRAIAGRTGGDAGMLLAAAERLADMPLTAWFHQGVLSWGAVRAIVAGGCGRCGSAPSTARPAFLVVADLSALDPDAPVGSHRPAALGHQPQPRRSHPGHRAAAAVRRHPALRDDRRHPHPGRDRGAPQGGHPPDPARSDGGPTDADIDSDGLARPDPADALLPF